MTNICFLEPTLPTRYEKIRWMTPLRSGDGGHEEGRDKGLLPFAGYLTQIVADERQAYLGEEGMDWVMIKDDMTNTHMVSYCSA